MDDRVPADGYLHGIIFYIHIQSGIFQSLDDGHPCMEPLHTLSDRTVLKKNSASPETEVEKDLP